MAVLQDTISPIRSAERAAVIKPQPTQRQPRFDRLCLAVFVLTLIVAVWFNFGTQHINCINSCDASEYIRDANGLIAAWQSPVGVWVDAMQQLLGLRTHATSYPQLSGLGELVQGGPVFPAFIAVTFLLFGTRAESAPVLCQCVLSAFAAALFAASARRAWNAKAGLITGTFCAVYPGFVVNTGRLYSESFAVFLFACALYFSIRGFERRNSSWQLFCLGAALASLQLTRSTMNLLSMAMLPICWMQQPPRQRKGSLIALAAGMAAVIIPWLVLQEAALGRASLIVDRVSHYNLFIGNNQKTQGWLTFPYPDGRGIEKKSLVDLTVQAEQDCPSKWAKLALDKPLRLFKFPWNDWRVPIGPFPPLAQVMLHQIMLGLCLLGIPLSLVNSEPLLTTASQTRQRVFMLAILLSSLAYLSFITVPRYNLVAMPIVVMFAGASVFMLWRIARSRPALTCVLAALLAELFVVARYPLMPYTVALVKSAATALVLVSVLKSCFFVAATVALLALLRSLSRRQWAPQIASVVVAVCLFPFVCLPLRAHGRWSEWKCPFASAGQRIEQVIRLPAQSVGQGSPGQCYLLIDANGVRSIAPGCSIAVNGVKVDGPVIPGLAAVQDFSQLKQIRDGYLFFEGEHIFDYMTPLVNRCNADLRQWLFVPVPKAVFAHGTPAQLDVVLQRNQADDNSLPDQQAAIFGNYKTAGAKTDHPSVDSYSWEKAFYGVENDEGLTDPRLDQWSSWAPAWSANDLSPEPGRQSGAYSIHLLMPSTRQHADIQLLKQEQLDFVRLPKGQLRAQLPALPHYGTDDLWAVRVSCAGAPKDAKMQILVASGRDGKETLYSPPWFPKNVGLNNLDSFDYSFLLAPGELPGRLNFLRVNFVSNGRNDAAKTTEYDDQASPAMTLSIWRLPAKPLAPGYQVF